MEVPDHSGLKHLPLPGKGLEQTLRVVFSIAGIVAGIGMLAKVLPFLIGFTTNLIALLGLLAGLGAMAVIVVAAVAVLFSPRMRTLFWYLREWPARWLTDLMVDRSPTMVLKTFLEYLKKQRDQIVEQQGNIGGIIKRLQSTISSKSSERDHLLEQVSAAKRRGRADSDESIIVNVQTASIRDASIHDYEAMLQQAEFVHQVLDKIRRVANVKLRQIEVEVEEAIERHDISVSVSNALASAWQIVRGSGTKQDVFNTAMDRIARRYADSLGQVDAFMRDSESMFASATLEEDLMTDRGRQMFQEWDKRATKLLAATPELSDASQAQGIDLQSPNPAVAPGRKAEKFDDLIH